MSVVRIDSMYFPSPEGAGVVVVAVVIVFAGSLFLALKWRILVV